MCNRKVSIIVKSNNVRKTTFLVESKSSDGMNVEMIMGEYVDRFSTHKNDIGTCKIICLHINTNTEDPPKIKRYLITEEKGKLVIENIELCEKNGICVGDNNVTWLMILMLVPNKHNKDRICLDSRPLNSVINEDSYTTLTLTDICCKLVSRKFFITLDLTQSFLQIVLDKSSSIKLRFRSSNNVAYLLLRMLYSLKIATALF